MTLFAIIAASFKKAWASFYESRNGPHWRAVRKLALIRDGHKCINCKSSKMLHVHHKCGWAWFKSLRFELSNLVTLCATCHLAYHLWNGGNRVKCEDESFYKWLKIQKQKKGKKEERGWLLVAALIVLAGLFYCLSAQSRASIIIDAREKWTEKTHVNPNLSRGLIYHT